LQRRDNQKENDQDRRGDEDCFHGLLHNAVHNVFLLTLQLHNE
jgi:hypothetical protein